jgi:peroxiredoxin
MTGKPAPFFSVESGNNEVLNLDQVKGKVLVIFYETKDASEKNRELKDYLDGFNDNQSETVKKAIVWLPVINCSQAFWPLTKIWRQKLREHSEKEGLTIYGDWTGKMAADYQVKADDSNFIIVDKKGSIRYFVSGKVDRSSFQEIQRLLLTVASSL